MNSSTDHPELLQLIAAGDQECMSRLIDCYSGLVWSIVRRKISDPVDAEDLVQEIFAAIWKSAHRYKVELGSEATFIAVITRRRVIDFIRKKTRTAPTVPFEGNIEFSSSADESSPAPESEISAAVQIFKALNPQRRKVLELSIIRGLSHSQIVESTGMPLGTVKAHIRRGLEEARALLRAGQPGQSTGEVSR